MTEMEILIDYIRARFELFKTIRPLDDKAESALEAHKAELEILVKDCKLKIPGYNV